MTQRTTREHAPESAGAPAIEFSEVIKSYGAKNVVDGLSFDVRPGECFGLLGPNGAGKTTTLRMLLGMTSPDHGNIRLVGEPVPSRARFAREIRRRDRKLRGAHARHEHVKLRVGDARRRDQA